MLESIHCSVIQSSIKMIVNIYDIVSLDQGVKNGRTRRDDIIIIAIESRHDYCCQSTTIDNIGLNCDNHYLVYNTNSNFEMAR